MKDRQKKGKSILFYGAGAIGRGFLAPVMSNLGYEVSFVDKNHDLIEQMRKRKTYLAAFGKDGEYEYMEVPIKKAYHVHEDQEAIEEADYVFVSVGPRNAPQVAKRLGNSKMIFSFENERDSGEVIKKISGVKETYFGIPDVITSCTAPSELLEKDPLCVTSENGEIVLEKGNYSFPDLIKQLEVPELDKYWACKFYLHNTPHAITAYMGAREGAKYIHEAMAIPDVNKTVAKAMHDLKEAIVKKGMVERDMAEWYVERELKRFENVLLHDPILRVAREPLRKLRDHDRLISVCHMLIETGIDPVNVCKGIVAALEYDEEEMTDALEIFGIDVILRNTCKLKPEEEFYKIIIKEFNKCMKKQ